MVVSAWKPLKFLLRSEVKQSVISTNKIIFNQLTLKIIKINYLADKINLEKQLPQGAISLGVLMDLLNSIYFSAPPSYFRSRGWKLQKLEFSFPTKCPQRSEFLGPGY